MAQIDSLTVGPSELTAQLEKRTLASLEYRIEEIDRALELLAQPSMRTGIGAIGHRSNAHDESDNTEWIQIDFGQEAPIDQVLLVPTIWRDTRTGFRADGFPIAFSITLGTDTDTKGTVVASFNAGDHLLPRVAPVVVPCPGKPASWVRMEATSLSPRAWDGLYLLQLSEILAFSGAENVALGQRVTVSSADDWNVGSRNQDYLVDGFVPYLMNAYHGDHSIAFVSGTGIGDQPSLTIDLESAHQLNRIHLHATDLSDTVPQSSLDDFCIPRHLIVEGANKSDFSDATELVEFRSDSIFDVGPILMRRFPVTDCRYVRLVAVEPYMQTEAGVHGSRIGFAEIELFANGKNVAVGKPFVPNFADNNPKRKFAALTDGNNLFGRILPIRLWLAELARRHDLETERPFVLAELDKRYKRQSANIRRLSWLAGLLACAAIGTIVIERFIRQRAILRTRERIAADVHDELGANIHAIGLLSDLAETAADSPAKLRPLLGRMRELTQRTGTAARYCANLLESEGLYENLETEMRRTSARIMADLDHEITIEGDDVFSRLKSRKRIDLYLFYKECLTNIIRHSGATQASTRISADQQTLTLTVADNGTGLPKASDDEVPKSLRRRARLLGARVSVNRLENEWTRVELSLRL